MILKGIGLAHLKIMGSLKASKREPYTVSHRTQLRSSSLSPPSTMASSRCVSQITKTVRLFSTTSAPKPSHHNHHNQNHKYLEPNSYIGSWEAPRNPKEAEKRLAQLRRDYAKQVKELRKDYIKEVELMRLEKLRKDEARKEALRLQNEERKKLKAEAAKARAQERQVAEQEFRQTLVCTLSLSHIFLSYEFLVWMLSIRIPFSNLVVFDLLCDEEKIFSSFKKKIKKIELF